MSELKREFGRWSEIECDECGTTFHITRTEPRTVIGRAICSDCDSYERGGKDAISGITAADIPQHIRDEIAAEAYLEVARRLTRPGVTDRYRFLGSDVVEVASGIFEGLAADLTNMAAKLRERNK